MPTYEYVCTDCQHQWEEIQKISEAPLQVCPNCAKSTAKRQISGGNFILKGGGWYADLYSSSGNSAKKSGGEAKASTTSSTESTAKTETKSTETKSSSDSGGSSSSKSEAKTSSS